MSFLEEYRNEMAGIASSLTGKFMGHGKIDQYTSETTEEGKEYKVHFSDNGFWLVVEIKVIEE